MKGSRLAKVLTTGLLTLGLTLTASADVVNVTKTETSEVASGVTLTINEGAAVNDRPQVTYVLEADPTKTALLIGGPVLNKSLVPDMKPITDAGEQTVIAAVNGDHFSFKTGIPMGMSISDGEIVTSPIPAYNADDYYFHALGLKADGTVVSGENPTLYMQYTVGEHTGTIDRINRTRENWEGGQICLYTTRYGESTDTNATGVDFVVRVDEGRVAAGSEMKGTIVSMDEDGDAPIEEGHVVLSISWLQHLEVEALKVGDELEFYFGFEQEEWNDVTFAVGGNRVAITDGVAEDFGYTVGAFTAAAPRTALGLKADGTIVLAAVDGRSEIAGGLTANEMTQYLLELGCTDAILLDGGGSTAMATADANGVLQTVNVPSEERPVGNGVVLVARENVTNTEDAQPDVQGGTADNGEDADATKDKSSDTTLWWICGAIAAAVVLAGAVVVVVVLRKKE